MTPAARLKAAASASLGVAVLKWPVKRALRRVGALDLVRRLLGRPPREAVSRGLPAGADLVLLRRDSAGLTQESIVLPDAAASDTVAPARRLLLAGGWGYGNLGDEAILAGYLVTAAERGIACDVVSVDPARTRACQGTVAGPGTRFVDESGVLRRLPSGPVVLAGGGYLNGSWDAEIGGKLTRVRRLARRRPVLLHAVELRGLADVRWQRLAVRALAGSTVSVRDAASADEAARVGLPAAVVVPDAISLLAPHVSSLVVPTGATAGRTLVNLLDVPRRDDAAQAEFRTDHWIERCAELVDSVGRPLGLAMDESDVAFLRDTLGLEVVLPRSVRGLLSALGSADGLVSMRMHPALVASMLGVPTQVFPYTGKVRPTLGALGLSCLVAEGEVGRLAPAASDSRTGVAAAWRDNHARSLAWLEQKLGAVSS